MNCWRCGQALPDGSTVCLYCGENQNRPAPTGEVGRAMRAIYDRYGAAAVLGSGTYLTAGLGDLVNDSKKIRNQIKMAMDAGVGRLYLEQLRQGAPDAGFDHRVMTLLTGDAALSDRAAAELAGYFDEMIGWRDTAKAAPAPQEPQARQAAPEIKLPGSGEIDRTGRYTAAAPRQNEIRRDAPDNYAQNAPAAAPKVSWIRFLIPLIVFVLLLVAAPAAYSMRRDSSAIVLSLICAGLLGLTLLLGRWKGARVVFAVLFGLSATFLTAMFLYFGLTNKTNSVPLVILFVVISAAAGAWMAISAAKAAKAIYKA